MTLRLTQRAQHRELARPAGNAHTQWLSRSTNVITLRCDSGAWGSGEAAPLPGFSPDTLSDCERALGALDLSGIPERLTPGLPLFAQLSRASERLPSTLPAARAALECALLDLWSRAAGVPAWALLGENSEPRTRRVAALLMSEPEQALEEACSARARGITAFKLKVGRAGAIGREIATVAALRSALGPDAELRLDANRAWSSAEAAAYLPRFAAYDPEFVEEPCVHRGAPAGTPPRVPLALDESLAELAPTPELAAEFSAWGVRALILKPTLLGGVAACAAWSEIARKIGAKIVLSHAFEGPLGLALSAALALTIGSEGVAHGLDLEGARFDSLELPYFTGAQIQTWSAPGFGDLEPAA